MCPCSMEEAHAALLEWWVISPLSNHDNKPGYLTEPQCPHPYNREIKPISQRDCDTQMSSWIFKISVYLLYKRISLHIMYLGQIHSSFYSFQSPPGIFKKTSINCKESCVDMWNYDYIIWCPAIWNQIAHSFCDLALGKTTSAKEWPRGIMWSLLSEMKDDSCSSQGCFIASDDNPSCNSGSQKWDLLVHVSGRGHGWGWTWLWLELGIHSSFNTSATLLPISLYMLALFSPSAHAFPTCWEVQGFKPSRLFSAQ